MAAPPNHHFGRGRDLIVGDRLGIFVRQLPRAPQGVRYGRVLAHDGTGEFVGRGLVLVRLCKLEYGLRVGFVRIVDAIELGRLCARREVVGTPPFPTPAPPLCGHGRFRIGTGGG